MFIAEQTSQEFSILIVVGYYVYLFQSKLPNIIDYSIKWLLIVFHVIFLMAKLMIYIMYRIGICLSFQIKYS